MREKRIKTHQTLQDRIQTEGLTIFLVRKAHSSSVSAASYFPCRLYRAPRFFSVVVTVELVHTQGRDDQALCYTQAQQTGL